MKSIIKPGLFEDDAKANNRREEFDYKNEILICNDKKVDICFIGDSITHFWELNAYFRQFGLVVNRGIGGDIVQNVYRRLLADAIQLKPKLIVIGVGVNNTWFLDELVERNAPIEEIIKHMQKNLEAILSYYKKIIDLAKLYEQMIIFTSVLPTRGLKLRNSFIIQINESLKSLCNQAKIAYVDYHTHMVDKDGLTMKNGMDHDTLHPHVYGYNVMEKVLLDTLNKVLEV